MKITLAFCVFNKAFYLRSLLDSWLSNLSGKHTYEVIVVCDACRDESVMVARATLAKYDLERAEVIETPDIFEIRANNAALEWASEDSDLIIFVQDDNWIYTPDWDDLMVKARKQVKKPGAIALLAGGVFAADGETYQRVEVKTPHKDIYFDRVNEGEQYTPGLYEVDFVTRPFAVSTKALRELGGLGGPEFDVLCWDDVDLCLKLQKAGCSNLYLSLDVLNTAGGQTTMPERMCESFINNQNIVMPRYMGYLKWRDESPFRKIADLD